MDDFKLLYGVFSSILAIFGFIFTNFFGKHNESRLTAAINTCVKSSGELLQDIFTDISRDYYDQINNVLDKISRYQLISLEEIQEKYDLSIRDLEIENAKVDFGKCYRELLKNHKLIRKLRRSLLVRDLFSIISIIIFAINIIAFATHFFWPLSIEIDLWKVSLGLIAFLALIFLVYLQTEKKLLQKIELEYGISI